MEEDKTEVIMFFVAASNVAVSTEVPVTPVAPPNTKIVIHDAEITLTSVQTSHVRITPQIF